MPVYGFSSPERGEFWGALDQLRREMNDLFGRGGSERGARSTVFPPVNVYESEDGYVVVAEVPGLRREDLSVSIERSSITLRGERPPEAAGDDVSVHRRERQSGTFRRTLELPVPADALKAEAVYRNGVLMVRLPKAPEHRPRQIAVES